MPTLQTIRNQAAEGLAEMIMAKSKQDPEREERIRMDIVVDAYDSEEVASGWYYYLDDTLRFPFPNVRIGARPIALPSAQFRLCARATK